MKHNCQAPYSLDLPLLLVCVCGGGGHSFAHPIPYPHSITDSLTSIPSLTPRVGDGVEVRNFILHNS